jgi:hypothetical protein
MTTFVLTTGYKGADVAHREKHQDIPACTAYSTSQWKRIELHHARLLNLNPCHARQCFPRGWATESEGSR